MNEELKRILGTTITISGITYPIAHMRYVGSSKTFVVWTLTSAKPGLCGDDEDLYSIEQVDIDVYSDGNYIAIVKAIKSLMNINDWVWVEDSPEMYEDDTKLYHRTITFEKERGLQNG